MVMPADNRKSVAEIREMIAAHKAAVAAPCNCLLSGPTHAFQCIAGGRMMDSAIEALLWVLGEQHDPYPGLEILEDYRKGKE